MPVIAYKNRLLGYNISFAFNTTYTKDFKLKNKSSTEYLTTEKNIINKVKYLLGKIFNFISIDEKSIKLIVRITDNILQKIVIPLLLFFLFFIIKVHFLFIYYTSITLFKLFINI